MGISGDSLRRKSGIRKMVPNAKIRRVLLTVLAPGIVLWAVFLAICVARTRLGVALPELSGISGDKKEVPRKPLCEEERSALRWLDHVAGELAPEDERAWWNIAGRQFGLSAKRYHIAFVGYAAAMLGMRGNAAERDAAGRILGRCVDRMLRREIWAYSQAKNYWGSKPWAPDPCYRENVMYTGHLLQLLALYECFTGDRRYWEEGFDFVWKDGRRVHYDAKRLIEVTVAQMRENPSGGITCEPGLMFFPCNNHPHIALKLFSKLGHGNWDDDARRWEAWALPRYAEPMFGGGAFNLVYHVKTGIMYPRGHNGLDGWALLWYEPWAADRRTALSLWRECAKRLDWEMLEADPNCKKRFATCMDPANVPPCASVSFIAAASRACDDAETAERLERIADRSLLRRDGMWYLDVAPEWRIGATANRIIALAIKNGSNFRSFINGLAKPLR